MPVHAGHEIVEHHKIRTVGLLPQILKRIAASAKVSLELELGKFTELLFEDGADHKVILNNNSFIHKNTSVRYTAAQQPICLLLI